MRRRQTEQERAHELLVLWGSIVDANGIGYPPAPIEPTVQGAKPEQSHPERYAHVMRHKAILDTAWRRLREESRDLAGCLWRCYVEGKMESQPRLREAQEGYLRHYEGLGKARAYAAEQG